VTSSVAAFQSYNMGKVNVFDTIMIEKQKEKI